MTPKLKKEIEDGLKSSWSPEQICGHYQLEQKPMVAFKTIYNWLYAGLIDLDLSVLRRRGKTRQPKETRGTFRIGTSIAKRPKEVRNRETFGLWELDTVMSSRGKSKGCLATFLERKTRFYLAFKIPDRTAKSRFSAIEQLCKLFPKEALKTFTSDRGKEFACYPLVENLGISFFFADPGCPGQRGLNEHSNGLLRRNGLPKQMDFTNISQKYLSAIADKRNRIPRKSLNYQTPYQVFLSYLKSLT